ncbi:MAG TPA: hypothetical protein VFT29_18335 [Gemmatimonadaceae bacterium]|nr:hypothetical protein [Gemmatimonadaceae bacterium]
MQQSVPNRDSEKKTLQMVSADDGCANTSSCEDAMERFLTRHGDRITATLSGFDRLRFRGSLRSLSYVKGLEIFLSTQQVLLKDFGRYVEELSDTVKQHAERLAATTGRPLEFLPSSRVSKEERARAIAEQDGVRAGLICILSCVESCRTYGVRKDRRSKHLVVTPQERKCLHLYFYFHDPEFGLMHIRLQTWVPFTIQICVNGREWLARQLAARGIAHRQVDNALTAIDDPVRAQALLDTLGTRAWTPVLAAWARRVNPLITRLRRAGLRPYYWSLDESEYATDLLFGDPATLHRLYPALTHHAISQFGSEDVLRFLGRRPQAGFSGEVRTLFGRVEGVRVKHWVEENSIKMYDKHGCILRIETTLNNPRRYNVRRTVTRQGHRTRTWCRLRKGVADVARRVEVSRAANARYLDALSVVGEPSPSYRLLDSVSQPIVHRGRRYRPLRPISPQEAPLLRAILRGEHCAQGFRNADLRQRLYPDAARDPIARRQAANRVTRLIRLLRAHRLVHKTPHTRYYRVSPLGHQVMSTALTFRERDLALLAA